MYSECNICSPYEPDHCVYFTHIELCGVDTTGWICDCSDPSNELAILVTTGQMVVPKSSSFNGLESIKVYLIPFLLFDAGLLAKQIGDSSGVFPCTGMPNDSMKVFDADIPLNHYQALYKNQDVIKKVIGYFLLGNW